MVNDSFFIVRRNLAGISFKGMLNKKETGEIHELLLTFIKKLPLNFLGNLHTYEENDYEETVKRFLATFHTNSLISDSIISHQFPLGSRFYASNAKDLQILTNYEDHFLICFRFSCHSLGKALQSLENILKLFEKALQELSQSFAFRGNLGFLTMNPNFCGVGVSLCYFLSFREKSPNEMQLELSSQYFF